ncbi:MAG TPA: hypothetical protein VMF13_01350 [Luteitalea sp.]|nr:hypothetical protein [Luteitalea sp.]
MSVRMAGVLAVVLCGALASPVMAQGLADVARKEAQRREQLASPGKVLTNADLPASAVVAPPSPAVVPAAEQASGEAPAGEAPAADAAPATSPAAPKDDEDGWKRRAATVNGAWNTARAQVRQLQALVDRLGLEMAATDKSIAERAGAERADVRQQLAIAREAEAVAAAARAAFEQEARASGVPAGWIQ